MKKKLLLTGLLVGAALLAACSAVSFTHANGAKGQSVTNAEVQKDNTVVLTYPNGTACIDTNPGESQTCKGQ
jgi:ABC-type glycerol-3-phosphate transport system substrate-binding protein